MNHVGLDPRGKDRRQDRQRRHGPQERARQPPRSKVDVAPGLERQPQRSVERQCGDRRESRQNRIGVQDSRGVEGREVGPERLEEGPFRAERDAADDVPERDAEEERQEPARKTEDDVPERVPHPTVDLAAELDSDGPPHEEPEHHHQRQVEPAEGNGKEDGEDAKDCRARGDEPDLVAVPDRADGLEDGAPLAVGAGDDEVQDSGAQVKAVQDDVDDQEQGDEPEPEGHHVRAPSRSFASQAGERAHSAPRKAP